jgi:hypothetical protein
VLGGESEGRAARDLGDRARGGLLPPGFDRQIRIGDLLVEQRVSNRAPDDPGLARRLLQGDPGRRDRWSRCKLVANRPGHSPNSLGTRAEIPQVTS